MLQEITETTKKFDEEEKIISYSEETEFLAMVDNALQKKKSIPVIDVSENKILKELGIAFTDNKKIFLNFKEIKELLDENYRTTFSTYDDFLLLVKALNYHELSHNIYTKYSKVDLDKSLKLVMNILEDQRIENLFFHTYKKSKYYFSNMYNETMIKKITKESSKMLYLLLYGRRFILDNPKIMKMVRNEFDKNEGAQKDNIVELEKIIDEYLITTNVNKQIKLGKKFLSLLAISDLIKMSNINMNDVHNDKQTNAISASENAITLKVKETINEEKKTASTNGNDNSESEETDILDIFNEMNAESVKSKKEIQKDTENMKKIMQKNVFGIGKNKESERNDAFPREYEFSPADIDKTLIKHIENTIKRLRIDIDNKTLYKQKKGKISMRNAMMNQSYLLNDFKKHIPSIRNKVNLDVSLVLDSSGSMGYNSFDTVLKTAWTISKAIENTNGCSRIIEFSDDYAVIKERHEKTDNALWGRRFAHGTQPEKALENIYNDLKLNASENKIVFLLTDGEYEDTEKVHKIVKEMHDMGIFTILIFVGNNDYYANQWKSYYDKYVNVNDFNNLPKAMNDIVIELQEKSIRRR